MITTLRTLEYLETESQFRRMADMSVEEMTTKANCVTDQSLESTRRMVQMTNDSLNVGVKTMTMLDEQGETLKNVEREMDQIKQDMKQARKNLNELSKCCGLCLCPCNRLKSTESDWRKKQVREPKESKQKVVSSQPTAVRNGQAVSAGSTAPTGPYIKRITNDDREDEMEENLSQVVNHIEILKNMALDLSNKIEDQIQIIDHANNEITTITSEVAAAEKQARKHKRNTERTTKS
ncbi:synaptosomal-associated protein 23-like isoform X2 [Sinocyclocheilus grahami]|uniref:synaptosomal-associated protein 23-like isoform X2 n=1 Tax=Sinocyclocheilus grahami TaxID=75366 RepID=UPI0007ACD50A|nr:PREDICTED: synaptosomal-associated protein 23-like isoform X2 [Sinocyclocheilus grahami]